MTLQLPDVTLCVVDCTDKVHLGERAIEKSLECADFGAVKLLTHEETRKHAVKIPRITSIEGYSKFLMRELVNHVEKKHALIVQWDGYPINPDKWNAEFLNYDYGGAPFQPSNIVGNGGFSLRSKKLLEACSKLEHGYDHPEDAAISLHFRKRLEQHGIKFMPHELARQFSTEGRSWGGLEWKGTPTEAKDSFGFHSYLTVLEKESERPMVYHHSGDAGDIVYSLATIKTLGGGVLYVSPDNKYPYPKNSRWAREGGDAAMVDSLRTLTNAQDYIWHTQYTHGTPFSTDYDLNKFREPWKQRTVADFDSIFNLHLKAFNVDYPQDKPWLTVKNPKVIRDRPIVVNKTGRYCNDNFDWFGLVQKYGKKMVFVGTEQEAELFQGFGAPDIKIPYYRTKTVLELAEVIAGAKVFIGNQSLGMAIALGLGVNVIQEVWKGNPNCRLKRDSAIYVEGKTVEIPKEWL